MTDFDTKVQIITDLVVATANVKEWDNFRKVNDLSIGLAVGHKVGACTLTKSGIQYVEGAYESLLSVLNVEGEFSDLGEIFDAAIANGSEVSGG